jgi:hypothetical protein
MNTIPIITNKKDIKGNRIYQVLILDNLGNIKAVFDNQIRADKGYQYANLNKQ